MRLGAHMSVAGGLYRAVDRAVAAGCGTLQVFTRNNVRWSAPRLCNEEVARFRRQLDASQVAPVFAHASYLINLASADATIRRRSESALRAEIGRCSRLGLSFAVMHPGAHMGAGDRAGLRRITRALARVLDATEPAPVSLALETTAGQGSQIGHRLEHLEEIVAALDGHPRLGVCVDTCHVFAAGYDLTSARGYTRFMRELLRRFARERILAWHLNDSRGALGSRSDRHAHIGEGCLGLEPFRRLMNDPRLAEVPMVLETPKEPEPAADRRNLATLRGLAHSRA